MKDMENGGDVGPGPSAGREKRNVKKTLNFMTEKGICEKERHVITIRQNDYMNVQKTHS